MNVDLRALGPERRGSTHSSRSCARELRTRWWADLQQPAMIGAEAKMRAASVVGAAAILILVGKVWRARPVPKMRLNPASIFNGNRRVDIWLGK